MSSRSLIFRPLLVVIFSLAGGLLYALWASRRYSGPELTNQYVYVVPIVVVYVAFLFDRAWEVRDSTPLIFVVDMLVLVTARLRMDGHLPYVSGHALFLTYVLVRPGSRVTRIAAALVMAEVIYLKFFVWHDLITPLAGITLGLVAALITRRLYTRPQKERSEQTVQYRTE